MHNVDFLSKETVSVWGGFFMEKNYFWTTYIAFMFKIKLTGFSRNILTLFSGSVVSNIITLSLIPFYTSKYTSDSIGIFFVYNSISIIISSFSTLQSHYSIILGEDKSETYRNFIYSTLISLVLSLLVYIPLLLFKQYIISIIGTINNNLIFLIPIGVLLIAITLCLENYFTGMERYSIISRMRVIRVGIMATIQVLFYKKGVNALIAGFIVGYLISIAYMFANIRYTECKGHFSRESINSFIKTHKNILTFNTSIVGILQTSQQIPTIAIAWLYGNDIAGIYGLAHRIIATPLNIIGQSFSQVYSKRASLLFNQMLPLKSVTKRVAINLFVVLLIPTLILLVGADYFFNLFDTQWEDGGQYLILIAPWVFMQSFNMPFTNLFTVLRIQKQILIVYIILLIQRLLSIMLPYYIFNSVEYTLISISVFSVVYYGYYYIFITRKAHTNDISLFDRFNSGKVQKIDNILNTSIGEISFIKIGTVFNLPVKWIMGKKELLLFALKSTKSSLNTLIDNNEKVLQLNFKKGCFGPKPGMQFTVDIPKAKNIELSYMLKFSENFDFTKGGKLPGLSGGKIMVGGNSPNGKNGWSARMMFLENGKICNYLYYGDMKSNFGEKHIVNKSDIPYFLPKNEWITINQQIKINDIGSKNGFIKTSINGLLLATISDIALSKTEHLQIDKLLFSCFHGGDNIEYAPKNDCYIHFKNFTIEYYNE